MRPPNMEWVAIAANQNKSPIEFSFSCSACSNNLRAIDIQL